jgi:hypothetical protein
MAVVLGDGLAQELMDVETFRRHPHIHIHFLTPESEYRKMNEGKLELCCHSCGASLLVYYSSKTVLEAKTKVKQNFVNLHARCPKISFVDQCPNYRSSFATLDIRGNNEPVFRYKKAVRRKLHSPDL